jgi:hypothetical protein
MMPKEENASGAAAWMPEESAYEGRDANQNSGNQVPVTPSSERQQSTGTGGSRNESSEEQRREGGGAPRERQRTD